MLSFNGQLCLKEIYFPTIWYAKSLACSHTVLKKKVDKKSPNDPLFPQRFLSAHLMDTLLLHEATGERFMNASEATPMLVT